MTFVHVVPGLPRVLAVAVRLPRVVVAMAQEHDMSTAVHAFVQLDWAIAVVVVNEVVDTNIVAVVVVAVSDFVDIAGGDIVADIVGE